MTGKRRRRPAPRERAMLAPTRTAERWPDRIVGSAVWIKLVVQLLRVALEIMSVVKDAGATR